MGYTTLKIPIALYLVNDNPKFKRKDLKIYKLEDEKPYCLIGFYDKKNDEPVLLIQTKAEYKQALFDYVDPFDDADIVYEYFIKNDDTWLREKLAPYDFSDPTSKAVLGTQVALLSTVKDGNNKDVAVLKVNTTKDTIFITSSDKHLAKVTSLNPEKEYVFFEDYKVRKLPFSNEETSKSYKKDEKVTVHQVCENFARIKSEEANMPVEGHWVESSVLRAALSSEELELAKGYKSSMAANVATDYAGFVEDFRKGGYFKDTEPLTWLEDNGLKSNETTFLGMKVSKIITPFKEVLEETEKNLKNDYPTAYNEILAQYQSAPSMLGQAQIRYIDNGCTCNPSNHSLGAAIDIRSAINPQITSKNKKYITFIKYMTGLDLTKRKTDQQVVDAQETFMTKIHGQKTKKYELEDINADYEDTQEMVEEFDLLAQLKDKDIEIKDFQTNKEDFVAILKAHKNRIIFNDNAKAAIDNMVAYLQLTTTGNTIVKKEIEDWDRVVSEKQAFTKMVKNCGFSGLNEFTTYFGFDKGQLSFYNKLLEYGFGESRIELVKSFHKAHQTISQKYTGVSQDGEWGGSYSYKYDGMHFGLKTSFLKDLTNKK